MNVRRLGVFVALLVMAVSGWYVFVYLYRWEWNRAIVSGIIFLAAEMGLLGMAILERLSKLRRRLEDLDPGRRAGHARVLATLREHPAQPARPFEWIGRSQTNVFVPVLLGAGVVLSALAWVVDRVARLTAAPALEKDLAKDLGALQPPAGGLLGTERPDPFHPR